MRSRAVILVLCLVCMLVAPLLFLLMAGHAILGESRRAQAAANAIDEAISCVFGGDERETISRRTGLAVIAGKPWGIRLAPWIDAVFGKGHCREKALENLV